jgi:hypothetical protein
MNLPVGPMALAAICAFLLQLVLRKPWLAVGLPTVAALGWSGWALVFQSGHFDSTAMAVFVGFSFVWIAIFLCTSALGMVVALVPQWLLGRTKPRAQD